MFDIGELSSAEFMFRFMLLSDVRLEFCYDIIDWDLRFLDNMLLYGSKPFICEENYENYLCLYCFILFTDIFKGMKMKLTEKNDKNLILILKYFLIPVNFNNKVKIL